MFSPLLDTVLQYGGALLAGIVAGLVCKAYYSSQIRGKIKGYQMDIVKSHSKILELEAKNEELEKRMKQVECSFIKDKIFMN